MSIGPQGPGWWQASDGRWYPPPPPPPGPYPQPPYGYPPGGARSDRGAVGALVLSIASFFVCPVVAALVALFLGLRARARIRLSMGAVSGYGIATSAVVISVVHLVLAAIVLVAVLPRVR